MLVVAHPYEPYPSAGWSASVGGRARAGPKITLGRPLEKLDTPLPRGIYVRCAPMALGAVAGGIGMSSP